MPLQPGRKKANGHLALGAEVGVQSPGLHGAVISRGTLYVSQSLDATEWAEFF